MPTYGYECQACSNQFETFQSIKDNPLTTCDACGGTLRKRVYPVGIAFKGSGFYVNDYAAKPRGDSKASGGDSKPAEASASTTDAKPAAETKTAEAPKVETKPEAAKPAAAKASQSQ